MTTDFESSWTPPLSQAASANVPPQPPFSHLLVDGNDTANSKRNETLDSDASETFRFESRAVVLEDRSRDSKRAR